MTIEAFPSGTSARIEYLKNHGSSLVLDWGEDTGQWEVSWITSGRRFFAESSDLGYALEQADAKAREAFGVRS